MPTLQLVEEFLNTVDERTFRRHGEHHDPGEHLTSPAALSDWLAAHDLPPQATEADLTAAVALRTALRGSLLGEATVLDHPLRLSSDGSGGLRLTAASGRPWLDAIIETIAENTATGDWKRVRLCAAPDCHWAFYDTSRSGRGRWCDMAVCGNRHKTRTYRERRHQTT
ncbi:CGNR zinc finger domain-containing protein [Actinoplanes sp. NPDC049265]|uniref:CGNR zinc finger domain-containing protein n=1 Tax=Actinoplanes sp. NPDC049265 TaxID=3363902 RepID=UPI00371EFCA0